MSQIFIYDYSLTKKDIILSDVKIKNYDSTIPQLTTIVVPKNTNIQDSDVVLIKDENMFIGIVERVSTTQTTEVAIYPIEHKFDNDLELDYLDGTINVVEYLQNQITRNFIDTDDVYMRFPFVFENTLEDEVMYKTIVETGNLLDVINEIYLNTGVFLDYEPVYSEGKLNAIKIIFKNVSRETIKKIRYDNPQIVDNVSYEFSNTNSNKVTIWVGKTEKEKGKSYKVYLREDNELTTNPADPNRIKKVINKNIDLSADYAEEEDTEEEKAKKLAEAIVLTANQELKSDIFGYKIEFVMLINKNSPWYYRQACVFKAEDKTYYTLVTRLEYLSDKHVRVTLGAYRTKLHEKLLKILKPKQVTGKSMGGISVTNGLGEHIYWFEQDNNGNLFLCSDYISEEKLSEMFELDADKNLYVNYEDNQRQALSIQNGELVGGY